MTLLTGDVKTKEVQKEVQMEATKTDYCLLTIAPEDVQSEAHNRGIALSDEEAQAFLLEHFDEIKSRLHGNDGFWYAFWLAVREELGGVYGDAMTDATTVSADKLPAAYYDDGEVCIKAILRKPLRLTAAKQSVGRTKMALCHSITIDGVEFRAVTGDKSRKQIMILQRGWVFVGDVSEEGDNVIISNAKCIRRWGTTMGLGELRTGPTKSTVTEPSGTVEVHKNAIVGRINVESGW